MAWIDLNLAYDQSEEIEQQISIGKLTDPEILQIINVELSEWRGSEKRKWMRIGEKYYRNEPDILERQRKAVGESGVLEPVENLANNKLVHAFTRKLVDQKVGYLLSLPMNIRTDNEAYQKELNKIFDKEFMRLIQSLGTESITKGIAWLQVYYDEEGNLSFMKIPSEQCIPIWKDAAHTELQAMIREYQVEVYEGLSKKLVTKVEWWDTNGVYRLVKEGANLIPDAEFMQGFDERFLDQFGVSVNEGLFPHVIQRQGDDVKGFLFEKVPFIAFKYNDDEIPLVKFIKSLVDDYDKQKSDNANNLEDLPNSIYHVHNYGDTDASTFRKNISIYRVVFTGGDGNVDSIDIPIETEAVKTHLDITRKDIYEFGRGVDTQRENFGNASGVALRFLYADLDLDCNIIENHFQAALEQLLWFIDVDLANRNIGNFMNEPVDFIFNRDVIINETEVIENINKSVDLSLESRLANHPYVDDVQAELERRRKEEEERAKREERLYRQFGLPNDPRNGGSEDAETEDETGIE